MSTALHESVGRSSSLASSARSLFLITLGWLLAAAGAHAQGTVTPTYPPINSFLWGNTSVNAPGKTSFVNGSGYGYRYLLPKNFNSNTKYPVIIFLHGIDESGTDNVLPLSAHNNTGNGVLALVSTANPNNQQNFPCFLIIPQQPVKAKWSSSAGATAIFNLLHIFQTQYPNAFDMSRLYITGLSEGGTSAYDMPYLMSQSNYLGYNPFAAAVPMSATFGFYIPRDAGSQPFMPMWVFHAADDQPAPIGPSDDTFVPAFRSLGFSVIYSRYQTGGHPIWLLAYQHPQLLPWLFAQSLGQPQAPLSNFNITNETALSGGASISLSGTASTAEGFTGITWSDDVNSQSGAVPSPITPTWNIPNIPIAQGTNHIQVTASAPNNTASVLGTPTNYGGTLTVNLPFSVSPTSNLALNRPVTVSSMLNSSSGGANAVDGSMTTRWSSAYSDPQWIEVDLGANYDLAEVDLNWETACGKDYQIQTSTDNVNWTTITNVVGNTTPGFISFRCSDVDAPARYVRMYGTAHATPYGYSLYEFAVYGQNSTTTFPPSLANIALNKPVTASSTETSSTGGANAVDGNANSRWSSLYSDPQWIEIDLGADYNIYDIDLNWQHSCGKNYQIQTSTDNVNWTTVTNVVGNTTTGLISYPYSTPISGRYVRMYGTARTTQYGYSLYEFAVYSDGSTATSPPPTTNLALNKTVTASSLETSAYPASNAVDGDLNTRWSSVYSDGQWLQVDLGAVHSISEVDLNWQHACGKNYQIQTSNDGMNWTTQTTVTGNSSTGWLNYPWSTSVSARYVRMLGTARATQYGYSLYEIRVLGQ